MRRRPATRNRLTARLSRLWSRTRPGDHELPRQGRHCHGTARNARTDEAGIAGLAFGAGSTTSRSCGAASSAGSNRSRIWRVAARAWHPSRSPGWSRASGRESTNWSWNGAAPLPTWSVKTRAGTQLLTQLENDRQLLAEAWERLERERIDAIGGRVRRQARRCRLISRTRPRTVRLHGSPASRPRPPPRPATPSRNDPPSVPGTLQRRPPHDGRPLLPSAEKVPTMSVELSLHQEHRNEQEAFRTGRAASSVRSRRRGAGRVGSPFSGLARSWQAIQARRPATRHTGESTGNPPTPRTTGTNDLGMTSRLIAQDRYAFVLLKEAVGQITDEDARAAWQSLNSQMALIPAGNVPLILCDGSLASVDLEGFYLDRCAVTNRQYQRFVQAGGYDDLEIWPPEVWPSVARFTDRSGSPGPRDWENGKFPAGLAEHPVVGVCWYEAVAYARWVGKRLPTAAEWQKAGGWPEQLSGGMCNRYPWGNMFEPARTNLSASGVGQTVPVREYPTGATPNGIYQMTGNVWEWLDDPARDHPLPAR